MFDDFITGHDTAPLIMIPIEQLCKALQCVTSRRTSLLNPNNVGLGQLDRFCGLRQGLFQHHYPTPVDVVGHDPNNFLFGFRRQSDY